MRMFNRNRIVLGFVLIALAVVFAAEPGAQSFKPKDGYVPDSKTAIAIAVAVWSPIYGEVMVAGEAPYRARLANGIWTVEGSLPGGVPGGVALAEIAKDDGRVLRVMHGQ
jgi:hypothetical protein